jgi:hypothetical protein
MAKMNAELSINLPQMWLTGKAALWAQFLT